VVMPGTEMDEAGAAAERLRHAVEDIEFIATSGIRTSLTVSVGVACTSVDAAAPDVLLKAADTALYEAKRKGRNRVELARAAATT
jgi:diguanylate cyclase (GGDEF)-like protein